MRNSTRVTAVLAVAAASLAAAPSALAGTATYSNNVPFFVPDGTTRTSAISVPGGRTAAQSIEVTNIGISWPASGQDMSAQLVGPDTSSMFLWEVGCFGYPASSSFTLTDSAPIPMPEFHDCDDLNLVGTSFRPVDPLNRNLSFFAGGTASGVWTLRVIDGGVGPANQGTFNRWALRIVHAPPTLTATAPRFGRLGTSLKLTAKSNANGRIVTGGGARPSTTQLTANNPQLIRYRVTRRVRNKIRRRGRALVRIRLAFTDATGGTANSFVSVKVRASR